MCENAVPILVVTTRGDAKTAYAAIAKGALDLVVKPDVSIEAARDFTDRLRLLSKVKVLTHLSGRGLGRQATDALPAPSAVPAGVVVAVAASTGGPDALSIILSRLPARFPVPIVIAQHISDGFVSGMVGWLKTLSRIEIKVAADGEALLPGFAYVCPSENHMRITGARRIAFVERHPKDIFRPSCDTLLASVGEICGAKAVGVILTGMGNDGVAGMKKIREAGGVTLAQDEKTSIVFGMPNLAIESGCIDRIRPLEDLAAEIVRAAVERGGAVPWPG
jgi:two-component system chemotaxis response regulator CheB